MNETKKILLRAAEIDSSEERAEYLAEACGLDVEMRRRIQEILGENDGSHDADVARTEDSDPVGSRPADSVSAATIDYSNLDEQATKPMLGPYRLMEKIGEGGMGVIYVAEQREPVSRRVAVKVIKPGSDTKEVIARFNAERQALAMMDHPNIARVFDAGETPEGRPYFVMELVRGIPVTKFCDQNKLSSRERLDLFIDVCHAIQHAHQKGIIHRDIKPSNVLVTSHDGKPVVKVIDFGVAKAINQRLTDQTVYTKFSQIVGTPLYMSPEQAEMSGLDIDTRSDIYSLGVLLYELLTGGTPHDRARLKQAAYDEMRRIIREEEPPRPSTRISTLGDTAVSISESRGTDPRRLTNILRGDLDWIVMKAMEKDRTRRYETANGFALDVKRFLDNEPVLASPPSTVYRLQKLYHRNRGAFAALAAIAAALVIGVAGTTFGMVSAMNANATIRRQNTELDHSNQQLADANLAVQSKNRELAESNSRETEARSRAERVKEFLVDAFRKTDPNREGQQLTVAEVLSRSVAQLETDLDEDQRTQADLLATIGRSFSGLGLYAESLEVFQREAQLRASLDPPDEPARMRADHHVGYALYQNGEYQQAIERLQDVVKRQRTALGDNDSDTLSSMGSLADSYMAMNRSKEAMELFQAVVTKRTEYLGEDHKDTLSSMADLAMAHQRMGHFDEALKIANENLEKHQQEFGEDHPLTLGAIGRLASIHTFMGKFETAIPLYRKAYELRNAKLGEKHPLTLSSKTGLGIVLRDAGELNESLEILDEVLAVKREELGLENHSTLASANNVARVYLELGRYNDALPLIKVCFDKHRELSGRKSKETVDSMNTLGMTYFYAGRPRDALPVFAELLEIQVEVLGEDNPTTVSIMNNLAMAHQFVGELEEALPLMQEAFRWRSENLGEDHPKTLVSQQNLASILRGVGRLDESIGISEETVRLHQKKLGLAHRQTVSAMSGLANAYVQRGDYLKALRLARETLAASIEAVGEEHPDTMRSMNSVGIAALGCGYIDEAVTMFSKTLELRRKKLGEKHSFTIQSIANLATGMVQADKPKEALQLAKEAREAADVNLKEDDPVAMNVKFTLGRAYLVAEDHDKAIEVLTELLKQRLRTVGEQHPNTWKTQHYLGQAHLEKGAPDQAAAILTLAADGRAKRLGDSSVSTINSRLLLAKCLVAKKKFEEAEQLLKQIWDSLPPVDEQVLVPSGKKWRVNTAKGNLALYDAWPKEDSAAAWRKRLEEEEARRVVDGSGE